MVVEDIKVQLSLYSILLQ